MLKKSLFTLCLLAAIVSLGNSAYSQALITSHPHTKGVSLPIRSHEVSIEINQQAAVTTIEQVFYNPGKSQVEGTYLLAVPKNASISSFKMKMNGEDIKGELLGKKEAEKIYQDIVRKLKDPGILSFYGCGIIRARVFPIEAKSTQKITIRYEEILNYDKGVCSYQYALASDKLNKQPIEFVKVKASISSNSPIKNIYSPSHEIQVNKSSNFKASVKYSDENVIPEQDFQLIFSISPDAVGLNLMTYKEKGEDGFFLLLAAPDISQKKDSVAKNVVFVLDKSGSMKKDNKIKQARDAMEFCIRSLNKKDHFAVVSFSDEIETLSEITNAKQDNIDDICVKLQKIDASGGTNIDDALQTAFALLPDNEKPSYIIFLTDGLPTVGVRNAKQILENAEDSNKTKCRVFTFGVGFDVNTLLLDQLSQTNKGLSTYVKPDQDIEVAVSSLYSKISDPVLADLKLDFDEVSTSKIYPRELPDLFSGSQLVVLGRYDKGGDSLVTLSGKAAGEKKRFKDEFSFTRKNTNSDFIPRLWAARRIGYLMNEIRINGKNKELVQEIVDLSKRFGILTEFTSFLVTDAPIATQPITREVRARENLRSLGYAGMKMDRGLKESSGKDAVANSEIMQKQLQNADSLSVQNFFYKYDADNKKQVQRIEGVRFAGQQAFFNQQNAWVSTRYDANQKTIQVKPFSAAYFQLADLSPDVSAILALGENVSFVRNDIMVQINEKGLDALTTEQINELR